MWGKPIATIPAGWQIADGTNGTLDLTDRFPRGASIDGELGVGGGSDTHDHTLTGDGHRHSLLTPPPNAIQAGAGFDAVESTENVTGTTDNGSTLPLFRRPYFIQKVA